MKRRTLFQAGAAAGLSAAVVAGRPASASSRGTGHIVLDYRPSQPTGWARTPGRSFAQTLGGHTPSVDFTFGGQAYRIATTPAEHPVFRAVPSDPDVKFRETLWAAYGEHHRFRYEGVLPGRFVVQSYGVFYDPATATDPATGFGGGAYVEYDGPGADDSLQWVQVIYREEAQREPESRVDTANRANPFYGQAGPTSILGRRVVNFHDLPQQRVMLAPGSTPEIPLTTRVVAETFLTRVSGPTVTLLGGFAWGWSVVPV